MWCFFLVQDSHLDLTRDDDIREAPCSPISFKKAHIPPGADIFFIIESYVIVSPRAVSERPILLWKDTFGSIP